MKNLLYFKYADLAAQLLALLVPFCCAMLFSNITYCFYSYLTVGSVQVLSCFMNSAYLPKILQHKERKIYIRTLVGFFIFIVVTAVVLLIIIGYSLLLVSPFIAAWYMYITYREIKLIGMVKAEGIEFKNTRQ